MSYNYNKVGWENSPSTKTPLNANNLNKMDEAIYSLHTQKQEKLVPGEGINIDQETNEIKVTGGGGGTDVQWNQVTTEGTKIAEITIDGEATEVFAPNSGASTWSEVANKPFSTIGSGLKVENDVLSAIGGGGSSNIEELTKAEYDAKGESVLTDNVAYFVKDYSEESGCVYDDTERVIGTWFGKKLYRKTYDFGSIGVSNVFQYTKPLPSNVEMITSIYGIAYNSSNPKTTRPLPMSDTSGLANNIRLDTNGTDIRLIVGTAWTDYKAYVTIEYTKVGE